MGEISYTRRGHPCPICGDEKGKCRRIHDQRYPHPIYYCMNVHQRGVVATIEGVVYECRGPDRRSGLWGEWIVQRSGMGQPWVRRKPSPPEPAWVDWTAFCQAAQEQDRQWRALAQAWQPLQKQDQQELHRRGIPVPNPLPFWSTYRGIAIPVLSPQGWILAYQERRRQSTHGRYRWLRKGIRVMDYVPIGLYGQPRQHLIICEGYLKAIATAYRYQQATIGVGSYVNLRSSYPLLRAYLHQYPILTTVALAPDKNYFTNSIIRQTYDTTLSRLKQDFPHLTVAFLTWPEHHLYDIDENPHPTLWMVKSLDDRLNPQVYLY